MPSLPAALAAGHLLAVAGIAPAPADAVRFGLLEALSQVPDPRDPRGVRYGLVPVLAVAGCATLAGARSYTAIAEWASDAPAPLRAVLELAGPVPDLVTIWRVLTAVDPAAPGRAIGAWVSAWLAASPHGRARVVLAVDGKTVRGARSGENTAPHLMACLDHASGVVRAQIAVDGKTSEIPMFSPQLDQIGDIEGALVTAEDREPAPLGPRRHLRRRPLPGTHRHRTHVMASLRNLAISILRLAGHISITRALRHTTAIPNARSTCS